MGRLVDWLAPLEVVGIASAFAEVGIENIYPRAGCGDRSSAQIARLDRQLPHTFIKSDRSVANLLGNQVIQRGFQS
jgi:hypothetical protein